MSTTIDELKATATSLESTSDLSSYVRQFTEEVAALPTYRPVMAAIIPAYNESDSIEGVLRSLLKQTRLPDEIHVIVNNSKDNTFELAAKFAGPRNSKRKGPGPRQTTKVFVHDIGENPEASELRVIDNGHLAARFHAYMDDSHGRFDDNGRKLRRVMFRWNGRFYAPAR